MRLLTWLLWSAVLAAAAVGIAVLLAPRGGAVALAWLFYLPYMGGAMAAGNPHNINAPVFVGLLLLECAGVVLLAHLLKRAWRAFR